MAELIGAVLAVILISALCSLFEAVLYSVPVSHVETLVHEGKSSGSIFRKLKENVDRPITAILSLNTFANTGGAFIAGAAFIKVYGDRYENHFTVFIALSVLFLSEIIPKMIGVIFNRPLSNLIARPIQILILIFTPMIWISGLLTKVIARGKTDGDVSGEELISLARLGQRTGAIEDSEARVIQNILSLKSTTAREVMTPRTVVFSVSEHMTLEEAHKEAGIWSHSRVPIYDTDFEDIVGIVLRKDALAALADNRERVMVSDLMRPVHFISESTSLDRILQMFLERQQHLFVVIDEYGGLAGVLTLEDILEEILGKQIVDELDQVTDMRALARQRRRQILEGGENS